MAPSTARRPKASEGRPAATEPTIVPINADATVNPSQKGLKVKKLLQGFGRARDDDRVEAEQQAAQCRNQRTADENSMALHSPLSVRRRIERG